MSQADVLSLFPTGRSTSLVTEGDSIDVENTLVADINSTLAFTFVQNALAAIGVKFKVVDNPLQPGMQELRVFREIRGLLENKYGPPDDEVKDLGILGESDRIVEHRKKLFVEEARSLDGVRVSMGQLRLISKWKLQDTEITLVIGTDPDNKLTVAAIYKNATAAAELGKRMTEARSKDL